MEMQNKLFTLGIPTYIQSMYIDVPITAQQQIQLPKQLPTQIGWIYGLSIYADNFTPTNVPQITTAEADNLFLLLKAGATEFQNAVRLSDLIYNGGAGSDWRYMPVNIPYNVSLDESYILNPTGIVGPNKQVMLNLWYIDKKGMKTLTERNIVLSNGDKK